MIVALTTASLDITLGVAWWTIKQVVYGAMYFGTYLFSESASSKKNKILGDDPNFVPHAFPIVDLEVKHSHTTINKTNCEQTESNSQDDFVYISKAESILTTNEKYFKIPLFEIIKRKDKLPLWFVPFLNIYPLTSYSLVLYSNNKYNSTILENNDTIFSPFKLNDHLVLTPLQNHFVYLNKNDVETIILHLINII